jgi:hypothetical protein
VTYIHRLLGLLMALAPAGEPVCLLAVGNLIGALTEVADQLIREHGFVSPRWP